MQIAIRVRHVVRRITAWSFAGLLCLPFTGCLAPKRTFVSEAGRIPRKTTVPEVPRSTSPKEPVSAEANPSVWSKLVGTLTPRSSPQTPPKAAVRIPLPRTDSETANRENAAEPASESLPF